MDATELSEQIKQHLEAGEWAQAAAMLTLEWNNASDFGVVHCDSPEFQNIWIRFKTSGYPFRLWREWIAANEEQSLTIIAEHIQDWNVLDGEGEIISLDGARDITLFDSVEMSIIYWMIRAFVNFWRVDLAQPRKN